MAVEGVTDAEAGIVAFEEAVPARLEAAAAEAGYKVASLWASAFSQPLPSTSLSSDLLQAIQFDILSAGTGSRSFGRKALTQKTARASETVGSRR